MKEINTTTDIKIYPMLDYIGNWVVCVELKEKSTLIISDIVSEMREFKIKKVLVKTVCLGLLDLELFLKELLLWEYEIAINIKGDLNPKVLKKAFPEISFILDCDLGELPPWRNFLNLNKADSVRFILRCRQDLFRLGALSAYILSCGTPDFLITTSKNSGIEQRDIMLYLVASQKYHFKPCFNWEQA